MTNTPVGSALRAPRRKRREKDGRWPTHLVHGDSDVLVRSREQRGGLLGAVQPAGGAEALHGPVKALALVEAHLLELGGLRTMNGLIDRSINKQIS